MTTQELLVRPLLSSMDDEMGDEESFGLVGDDMEEEKDEEETDEDESDDELGDDDIEEDEEELEDFEESEEEDM